MVGEALLFRKKCSLNSCTSVKYANKIFSGFGSHSCVASRIRIRISTSWVRTGIGLEKTWLRAPLVTRSLTWFLRRDTEGQIKKNVCAAEVAGLNFSDSHSAPVPKFLYPGPCPVIFQIWKSDSCSDPGYYHHGSNWNLPTFLLNKWQHRRLLLPKLKSDPGSGHCVSQIFDSRIRVWKKRRILPESTPDPWSPLAWRRAAPQS